LPAEPATYLKRPAIEMNKDEDKVFDGFLSFDISSAGYFH
jgi:hypothetical protein